MGSSTKGGKAKGIVTSFHHCTLLVVGSRPQARSHVSQIAQSKQSRSKKKKRNRKRKKQKTKETKRKKKPSQSAKSWMIPRKTPVQSAACDCCSAHATPFCAPEVCDGAVHDILQAIVILCNPLNLFARASLNICGFCRLFLLSISQFPSLFLLLSVF